VRSSGNDCILWQYWADILCNVWLLFCKCVNVKVSVGSKFILHSLVKELPTCWKSLASNCL